MLASGGTGLSLRAGGIVHAAHLGWLFFSPWEALDAASVASCAQLGHRCAAARHTQKHPNVFAVGVRRKTRSSETQARNWIFLGSAALSLKAHLLKELVLAQPWGPLHLTLLQLHA